MKSLFKQVGLLALLLSSAQVSHSQNNQAGSPGNSGSVDQIAVNLPEYQKGQGGGRSGPLDASFLEAHPALKERFSHLFPQVCY